MNRRQLTLSLSFIPALLASALVSVPALVVAQNKPISIVVPYPAGGPLDISARILAEGARSKLDASIVVENKPGAGGTIGANQVAKSAPGSQQLLMGAIATHAANPWLMPNYPFDPIKDFKPVSLVAQIPNVLVMNIEKANQFNIRSTGDLVAYIKKNPGKLNYSSGGNGSIGHIAGEMLKSLTKSSMVHIPYSGAGPAQLALLSGQVDVMFDNLASALPQIRAGKLLALGVTTQKRSEALPDVPPVNDTVKGFDVSTWFGIFAPSHTSDADVQKYAAAFADAMHAPDNKDKFSKMGFTPERLSPVEFAKFVQSEHAKYGTLIKAAGIKLD
ncbi:MAG TPA: tripartite tricarboxylate transporter substrate binding protein [Burkholderiaceae bacterium]|nr:tripartite tricarboxylate transporter substrate binding protein [Burkholderiaceae bacterium]